MNRGSHHLRLHHPRLRLRPLAGVTAALLIGGAAAAVAALPAAVAIDRADITS